MSTQPTDEGPWKCGNELLPYHPGASHVDPAYRDGWNACYREAFARWGTPATGGGPVAWRVRRHDAPNYWIVFLHYPVDAINDPEREVQPLYTSPQPVRKPLTDDELWKFWWARPEVPDGEDDSMEAEFVAAARRLLSAHGITGGQT